MKPRNQDGNFVNSPKKTTAAEKEVSFHFLYPSVQWRNCIPIHTLMDTLIVVMYIAWYCDGGHGDILYQHVSRLIYHKLQSFPNCMNVFLHLISLSVPLDWTLHELNIWFMRIF